MARRGSVVVLWLGCLMGAAACGSGGESPACERNSQCPVGFQCRDGLCLPQCVDETDCSGGEVCLQGVCQADEADAGAEDEADIGGDASDVGATPLGLGPGGQPVFGAPLGGSCDAPEDCRDGLVCGGALVCEADGSAAEGAPCTISAECGQGLACGVLARCVPSRGAGSGEACSVADLAGCGPGLRCRLVGLAGTCTTEGVGDLGSPCLNHGECADPLACSPEGTCQIPIFGGISLYEGVTCAADRTDDFKVYFEVPRGEPLREFYRLPYPNDIRRTAEGIDMSGHPAPPLTVLGGDFIQGFIDALASSGRGFSTNPTVIFRLSSAFDFDSIRAGGDDPTLFFVNIDPDSPRYGRGISMFWEMTTGRGKYLCPNSIAIHPSWHSPLPHASTWAVYLTDGIRGDEGLAPVQDGDLAAVLEAQEPENPHLAAAWQAYAPFRAYLADQNIPTARIAGATVFTTMDPDSEIPKLREAIRSRLVEPALENLVLCEEGAVSPCDDGDQRVCIEPGDGVLAIHGTYRAPVYQTGIRPYLTPADGGNLVFDANGLPESQAVETMCVSIAIPDAPMPPDGWPVVLYGHGTGGDFLTHIRNGTAGRLAAIDLGDDEPVRLASIGIDGVQHGPRRGSSNLDPEVLFYNLSNPRSWLGNVHQGAADYFYLTWLVETADISAEDSPTGQAIRFDTGRIYYFGHSQGATVGAPFVAYEPAVRGAVFSGAGASLVLALLNKESPVPVSDAVQLVLNDGEPTDVHPVLSLLQQVIDPVDPININRLLYREPPTGVGRTHLFMSYGLGDTYAPDPTIEVFASQAGVQLGLPTVRPIEALAEVDLPARGNVGPAEDPVTAVLRTYQPGPGDDGHFVIFRDEDALRQSLHFLGSAARDGIPTVPQ